MRFKSLISHGFGCLPDGFEVAFAPKGVTILLGQNEWGKSTMVQGLLAGLFGEPHAAKEARHFRQAYAPWSLPGSLPRLTLEVATHDDRLLAITREFGSRTTPVRVVEVASRKDLTLDFQVDKKTYLVGEQLTGLMRPTFEKTALLLQGHLQSFENNGDLIHAIEEAVISGTTGVTSQMALDELKRAERQTMPGENPLLLSSIISRLDATIAQLEKESKVLEADYEAYQASFKALDVQTEAMAQLDARIRHAEMRLKQAEYTEVNAIVTSDETLRTECDELRQQQALLEHYADFPIHQQSLVQETFGQLSQVRETMSRVETLLVRHQEELDQLTEDVTAFPWLINSLDRVQVDQLIVQLQDARQQYLIAQAQLDYEANQAVKHGGDLARFSVTLERLEAMTAEQQQSVHHVALVYGDVQKQITEIKETLSLYSQQLLELNRRVARRRGLNLGLILAGLCLAGLACSPLVLVPWMPWLLAISGLLGLVGVVSNVMMGSLFAQRQFLKTSVEEQTQQESDLLYQRYLMQEKWVGPDTEYGREFSWFGDAEVLDELAWYWAEKDRYFSHYVDAWQTVKLREADLNVHLQALATALEAADSDEPSLELRLRRMDDLLEQYQAFGLKCQVWEETRQRFAVSQERLAEEKATRKRLEATLMDCLQTQCGLSIEQGFDAAVDMFLEGVRLYHEYNTLKAQADEKTRHLKSDEQREAYYTQLQALAQMIEHPIPADLDSVMQERQQVYSLRSDRERMQEAIYQLQLSIKDKQDRFNRDYPQIQAALEEKQALRERYQQFQEALTLAQETLQEVAQDEYSQWAFRLNNRVNAVLNKFRSPYQDIRFQTDLQFSVVDGTGREFHQREAFQSLSCGTKDQIYLAIRMAITEHLSQEGEHLPIILDDPFVNFDDERFFYALETLAKYGFMGRQILIFSCHQARFEQAYRQLQPKFETSLFLHHLGAAQSPMPKVHILEDLPS